MPLRRSRFAATCLVVTILSPSLCRGADILVPADQPTIQLAIDAASDGDTVLVAPGTYLENIDLGGKAITVQSELGPEFTTIDGSALTAGPDQGSVVTCTNGEGASSAVVGFTLTGGIGTLDAGDRIGGGVLCLASGPLFENDIVVGNTADLGGGIYCESLPSPQLLRMRIEGNAATTGGGLYCEDAGPIVVDALVVGNSAGATGGGIYCFFLAAPTITCSTITANSSGGVGPAIACDLFAEPDFYDCVIWGNSGATPPPVSALSSLPSISYSVVELGWSGQSAGGIVDADPQFSAPASGDYTLLPDSPAIDSGSSSVPFLPELDLAGAPRVVCDFVDMGAFESPAPAGGCPPLFVRGDCDGDDQLTLADAIAVLAQLFASAPVDCLLACDGNGDGANDLADAIYLLEAQFVPASPPPPAPFPECGRDPAGGDDCEAFPSCT